MKVKVLIGAAAILAFGLMLWAAQPSTYQVTGPVLELKDDMIIIQKGTEKWEIARTPDTKITGELKVGEKVTIHYRMTAASIEVKPAKVKKEESATPEPKKVEPVAK
jgi:hypothetical protein